MYVYFDRTGTIKEIISESIRQGSSSNYIYCYFEGGNDIDGLWWTEKKSDGTIAQPETMTTLKITKPLPYDLVKDRDLKYFNEYERYPFWTIQLQTSNLNVDGLTLLTIRAMVDSDIYAQGLLTFEIESGVINYDNVITQSQYDYLLQLLGDNVNNVGYFEIDSSTVDGTYLTQEQINQLNKEYCVVYDTRYGDYYIKTIDIGNQIYFNSMWIISTMSSPDVRMRFNSYQLMIDVDNDYKVDFSVDNWDTYSKTQLDTLFNGKLDANKFGYFEIDTQGFEDGYLTAEQIVEVEKDFCVIYDTYRNEYYYKATDNGNVIRFYTRTNAYSDAVPINYITIRYRQLVVTREDNYLIENYLATTYDVYTKSIIDALLNDKLDDSQLKTSWSGTPSDSNIPSEKLVKDSLDDKLDKNASITGATKTKITYDSKGLVTAGADLVESDIPTLSISKISGLQSELDDRLDKKPDGTNNLISNNKIATSYLPDYILGQMIYGGTFNASTGVATLSTNAKEKLGTTSNTITLTNNTTAITGYVANEGIYYVVSTDGTFANQSLLVGDWLISTGSAWVKIDNTDAVSSVNGQTGAVNVPVASLTTTTGSEAVNVDSVSLNVVTRDTTQDITGEKTFKTTGATYGIKSPITTLYTKDETMATQTEVQDAKYSFGSTKVYLIENFNENTMSVNSILTLLGITATHGNIYIQVDTNTAHFAVGDLYRISWDSLSRVYIQDLFYDYGLLYYRGVKTDYLANLTQTYIRYPSFSSDLVSENMITNVLYGPANNYSVGDIVIYNSRLYRCKTAYVSGWTFDDTKWDEVRIIDLIDEKMANPMTTANDIIVGGSSGVPTRLAKGNNNQLLGIDGSGNVAYKNGLPYLTTAPTSDNTDGLIIVVLSSEPATYYNGYYYIITTA